MGLRRHIVILAHFAGAPKYGMVTGYYYLAKQWISKGYEVSIVSSGYSHTRNMNPQLSGLITEEHIDGIRYLWLKAPKYNPANRIGRVANILLFSLQCYFLRLPMSRVCGVICSSHHPFPIYAAEKLARKKGAKLIFEVRDLWPLTLMELGGASKKNPFIHLMQRAEDRAYKNSDAVVSVLSHSLEYMKGRGLDPVKFNYIPNGIVEQENVSLTPEQKETSIRKFHEIKLIKENGGRFVGYAGRVGLANAVDSLIESLSFVEESVHAAVLGDGPFIAELRRLVAELKLEERVHFLGYVEKPLVPEFLELMDVAYLGLKESPLFRYGVSPTKLGDYMLSAKPVLAAFTDPENVVEKCGAGIAAKPGDARDIAASMNFLVSQPKENLAAMGKAGYDWITVNRNYSTLADNFLSVIEEK